MVNSNSGFPYLPLVLFHRALYDNYITVSGGKYTHKTRKMVKSNERAGAMEINLWHDDD